MPQFTKGKWKWDGTRDMQINTDGNPPVYIASVYRCITTEAEDFANARLIAEAPTMYDLLNKAFHMLGKNAANDAICREIDECLSRVDGAPVQKDNGN